MSVSKNSAREAIIPFENSHDTGDPADNNAISERNSNCSSISDIDEVLVDSESPSEVEDLHKLPTFVRKMLNLCRELIFFCLILLTYAVLHKNPPKITKPPAAYPFFPPHSIIVDSYRGHVNAIIDQARSSDVAFVMFYAPWDAESQAARKEFETTAKYMQQYVSFTAINCWQPNSECRIHYSKVYRWPALVAFPSHGRGVQYNGPIKALHMIKFLQKVCNPFVRLTDETPRDFEDAYVTVHLNALPKSKHFAIMYTTILKYLEQDPMLRLNFYINPVPSKEPKLLLHMWNETLIYPLHDRKWKTDDILQWIFKNVHTISAWISPSGSKSLALSTALQTEGPTLVLFSPGNPLHYSSDYYNLLQEIGQEYNDCDKNMVVQYDSNNLKKKRSANIWYYQNLKLNCKTKDNISQKIIISHLHSSKLWTNTSGCSDKDPKNYGTLKSKLGCYCNSKINLDNCVEFKPTFQKLEEKSCQKQPSNVYKISMVNGENDFRSPKNLLKHLKKERCRQFLTAENFQPAFFEKKLLEKKENFNIKGLACRSNRSLTLIAIDSLMHYHFAETLGVNLTRKHDKSSVVIIDEKVESHYIMEGAVNGLNIRNFIRNFTTNSLKRSLRSKLTIMSPLSTATKDKSKFSLIELNTDSFLPTILQENKAVVLMYYSKQCSFCNGISYTLLTMAKKLKFVKNLLFTRIDGDINILPWQYTMESYPTILFFPANAKSESRVFPSNIPITVPNLAGFILTNLDKNIRLHAMWSICNQTKFEDEKTSCYSSIRSETLALTENTLREWRKSNKRRRQVLLCKLVQLKHLHLLFAHFPQKYNEIQNYFIKLTTKISSDDYRELTMS